MPRIWLHKVSVSEEVSFGWWHQPFPVGNDLFKLCPFVKEQFEWKFNRVKTLLKPLSWNYGSLGLLSVCSCVLYGYRSQFQKRYGIAMSSTQTVFLYLVSSVSITTRLWPRRPRDRSSEPHIIYSFLRLQNGSGGGGTQRPSQATPEASSRAVQRPEAWMPTHLSCNKNN